MIALLVIALFNMATAFLTWRTHIITTATHSAVVKTQEDVATVEKATNSVKDAPVAATAKSEFARGKEQARVEGIEKAATLAEGKLVGKRKRRSRD